jgi:hypothetical protein
MPVKFTHFLACGTNFPAGNSCVKQSVHAILHEIGLISVMGKQITLETHSIGGFRPSSGQQFSKLLKDSFARPVHIILQSFRNIPLSAPSLGKTQQQLGRMAKSINDGFPSIVKSSYSFGRETN